MSRFDLNLLAPLDALLRERNVTVAAERLGVSQPTMSGSFNACESNCRTRCSSEWGKHSN